MAFKERPNWSDGQSWPTKGVVYASSYLDLIFGSARQSALAERLIAGALATSICTITVGTMALWLRTIDVDSAPSRAIETIELSDQPPPDAPRGRDILPQPIAAGVAAAADPAAPALADASPAPSAGMLEWSMSRIAVPTVSRRGPALPGGRGGGGIGSLGGSGVFDPYAGSTPQWQPGTSSAGQPAVDAAAMARLQALMTSRLGVHSAIPCQLFVGIDGALMTAQCQAASPGLSQSLAEMLVGVRLFAPSDQAWQASIQL